MFRITTLASAVGVALAVSLGSHAVAQDITTGLLGHWKLDEGFNATTAVDSAGSNDGMVQGAVTTGLSGRVDNGYTFAGTNGNRVLTTATAPGLGIDTGPMSMFGFIKTADIGTVQQHIFSGNNGAAGRWNLGVIDNSAGSVIPGEPPGGDGVGELFWFHNGGVGFVHTDITLSDNIFHLVGVSRDASNNWTAYVDTTTFALGNSSGALNNSAIAFGERPNAGQFPFEGTLDDMRIYNRVLTAGDIGALLAQPMPSPTPNQWLANATGSWFNAGSWLTGSPNSNTQIARFGTIPTNPNVTVVVDSPVTTKGVAFDNGVSHFIVAGTKTVTLDTDTGTVNLTVEQAGSHEFQAAVSMADNVAANIVGGGRLDFNNALNLNGNTLTKSGNGTLNINNQLNSGSGSVVVTAGVLGGTGEVGGSLTNQSGGIVAPGRSAGTLSVATNYTQAAGATLAVELGGTADGLFDLLDVAGTANLMGTIDISLIDGFTPASGNSFKIVSSSNLITSGLTLAGQSTGFSLSTSGNNLFLNFSSGLNGDYNGDGKVNAADYVLWRKNPAMYGGNPAGYNTWRANFGNPPGSGSAVDTGASVPEPSSGAIFALLAGVAMLACRTNRK